MIKLLKYIYFQKKIIMQRLVYFLISYLPLMIAFPLLSAYSHSPLSYEQGVAALAEIHSQLNLLYGSFLEEYPEQLMAVRFIPSNAHVLELGGNVGRNSCVIAKILDNSMNLVTLESSPSIAKQLVENRDWNGLAFFVEAAALSKVPLIQNAWITVPGSVCPKGYFPVKTISFEELQKKYDIEFDVLVADCEGALYQILKDDESLLQNIKLILVENDYHNDPKGNQYKFTKEVFKRNGYKLIYSEPGAPSAVVLFPYTINLFYQVWAKD
jgi:FkbM family methyltransferase